MTQPAQTRLPPDAHPSPHADRVSRWTLITGLWLAPAVWFVQLAIDTWIGSHACYPLHEAMLTAQAPLAPVLAVVDGIAVVLAAFGGVVAWRGWRATKRESGGRQEKVLESGSGRARFLCMAGMLTSAMVLVAMAYVAVAHAALPVCGT